MGGVLKKIGTTAGAGREVAARIWQLFGLVVLVAVPCRHVVGQTAAKPDTAGLDPEKSVAVVAGRQIFHGVGTCFACHGAKLEGTIIAPTLRAHKWRNGDGTLDAIVRIVTKGVPNTLMVSHPGGISRQRTFPSTSWLLAGEEAVGMVPTFTREPIDGVGAQLCPCSFATTTPQTFVVASPSAISTDEGVLGAPAPMRAATQPTSVRLELVDST